MEGNKKKTLANNYWGEWEMPATVLIFYRKQRNVDSGD